MSDHPHDQCATCLAAVYASNVVPLDEPMHSPSAAHPARRGLTDEQVSPSSPASSARTVPACRSSL